MMFWLQMDKRGWTDDAAHHDAVNGSNGFGYTDADTGGDKRSSPQAAGKAGCHNADGAPAQRRLLAFGPDHDRRWHRWERAIPRQDIKPLAKRLIDEFGSLAAPMAEMPEELKRVEGLGDGTAAAIKFFEAVMLRTLKTRALDLSPAPVLMVHNLLSDDPPPSGDNIQMSHAIIAAGRRLDLTAHDHVITGSGGHVAMRAQRLI